MWPRGPPRPIWHTGLDGEVDLAAKVASIAGITGQDGADLARLLLSKGKAVHGIKRCSSTFDTARVDAFGKLRLLEAMLLEGMRILNMTATRL